MHINYRMKNINNSCELGSISTVWFDKKIQMKGQIFKIIVMLLILIDIESRVLSVVIMIVVELKGYTWS